MPRLPIPPLLIVLSLLFAQATPAAPPAADAVVSPEVYPDRRATFRLYAPKASEVTLFGDWMPLNSNQPMTKDDQGVWSVTVGPLSPGISIYTFTIDGMTIADPVNPRIKLRWRTSASLVEIPGDAKEPPLWEPRDVPHGKVEQLFLTSRVLAGQTRSAWVYTPPGYSHDTERYPVLYLLHGHNDTAAGWTMVGGANFILDNLLAANKATPMIIVMPYGHALPYTAPRDAQAKNTTLVEQYLIDELLPAVDREYRTIADRDHRAIAGYSMGGGHALAIALDHPSLFSALAPLSSAIPPDFQKLVDNGDAQQFNAHFPLFYIGCGQSDPFYPRWQKLHDTMATRGIRHTFHPREGAHVFAVWRSDLCELLPLLFHEPEK
jgi:enterochelin esterase-like enzyme